MQFLVALILFLTTTSLAAANCNFVSADYIDELSNPKYINSINVTVPKSAKFAQNFLKIAASKTENIPPELKKKFKAKVTVKYSFGSCTYKAKVKQNGDWKDHIAFLPGGKVIRSLNVKLQKGNIVNAVKFKLLLPETREDLKEVFAAVVFRTLGFLAPETFKVDVSINGVRTDMIFQEDSQKELLERNSRREGPIFEGDESLLWGNGFVQNEDIALTRVTNEKWFLKGNTSATITTEAFKRMQLAYLTRADHLELLGDYIQSNISFRNILHDFDFISLALDAKHTLRPHNRKFYFNVFLDEFEPIYYDGNVKLKNIRFKKSKIIESSLFKHSFSKKYKFSFFDQLDRTTIQEKVLSDFVSRSALREDVATSLAKKFWSRFKQNSRQLQDFIDQSNNSTNFDDLKSVTYEDFISRTKITDISQKHVLKVKQFQNGTYPIVWEDNSSTQITPDELADIIANFSHGKDRVILIDEHVKKKHAIQDIQEFNSGYVVMSPGMELDINAQQKQIQIKQTTSKDWILFVKSDLSDWKVELIGKSTGQPPQGQRFNEFGMTGCINFFEVTFSGASIETNYGDCEDSVNLVKSNGFLSNITVKNALSDAIDIDFSHVQINNIDVENAGNDCFDVSGGSYEIKTLIGKNCGDKGISVGENSKLFAETVKLDQALLGVSSKDLSQVTINNADIRKVQICYEAAQKKQEFGGGRINISALSCIGTSTVDKASSASVVFQ